MDFFDISPDRIADLINGSSTKAVIIATGGGSGIFPLLLDKGGGSKTLLSGIIPYTEEETISLLGGKPDKLVSEQVARSLAMVAYLKAVKLNKEFCPVVGLACTASLQKTPQEREGREHVVYAALQTKDTTISTTCVLNGNIDMVGLDNTRMIRIKEEEVTTRILLSLLADACDLKHTPHVPILKPTMFNAFPSELFGRLLSGKAKKLAYDGLRWNDDSEEPAVLFPGSFNPLHEGHMEMIKHIRALPQFKNKRVDFEISMFNVDKPPLDFITLKERLEQFTKFGDRVWVTNAPTFVDKSRLFPGASFIVGHDTYLRILDPKYAGSIEHVCSMFEGNNNYFYIFPRNGKAEGIWRTKDTCLPGEFVVVPRKYEHLRSTDIRRSK